MISARDEIWIDMMQFDVRAADQLWEGTAPAYGAPEWYEDVSGLIETASGPAEPRELVDEPVVVEDMHRTTLGRAPQRCHHRRTVGRVIAMKAAAMTTAGVFGVAAAAAATTGIVATVAGVVVPVIEEHVLSAEADDPESVTPPATPSRAPAGRPGSGHDDQLMALSEPPPATVTPAAPPTDPAPVDAALPTEPAPVDAARVKSPPKADPPPVGSAPAAPPSAHHKGSATSPPADPKPGKVVPSHHAPASPDASHKGSDSGKAHKGGRKAAHDHGADRPDTKPAEHPPPAHSRRSR